MSKGFIERAEHQTDAVQKVLAMPQAYLLPQPVKAVIQSMAHLMEDMAREIERLSKERG